MTSRPQQNQWLASGRRQSRLEQHSTLASTRDYGEKSVARPRHAQHRQEQEAGIHIKEGSYSSNSRQLSGPAFMGKSFSPKVNSPQSKAKRDVTTNTNKQQA